MKGLKTQESKRFNAYFALVQSEAAKQGKVFYLDAGDGRDFETADMEGEDMMGWLIPLHRETEFESAWNKDTVSDDWDENYVWAVWERTGEIITVRFENDAW